VQCAVAKKPGAISGPNLHCVVLVQGWTPEIPVLLFG